MPTHTEFSPEPICQPKSLNNVEHTMNTRVKSLGLLCTALLGLATGRLHAQFDQVTAGAVSTSEGAKLLFSSAASFEANSGYVHPLIYTLVTNFSLTNVIYSSTNLQFWALSNRVSGGAAMGSYLVCEVLSVTGPSGSVLSFWEQGWRTPTYHFPVGVSPIVGSNRFDVSDISTGAGLVDGDPAGRIPTRRFTVNMPGDYFMTFKLFDTSTNTPAGGPMHTPSDPLTIKFSTTLDLAITRIARNTNAAGAFTLTFKQSALTNVVVEANTNLTLNTWTTLIGPFTSAPAFNNPTTLNVTNPATIAAQFYRLRGSAP
jgi:hypothetical protein